MIKKTIFYVAIGSLLGLTLAKTEAISWYKIYEMFLFESFHMYGLIGSALVTGILLLQINKRIGFKNVRGDEFNNPTKEKTCKRYMLGGTFFGIGWALCGACPAVFFILLGENTGIVVMLMLLSALAGSVAYGLLRKRLPH